LTLATLAASSWQPTADGHEDKKNATQRTQWSEHRDDENSNAERKTETKGATRSDVCAKKEKAPNSVGAQFLTCLSYQVRDELVKYRISSVIDRFEF
jgi:hypothetical protein